MQLNETYNRLRYYFKSQKLTDWIQVVCSIMLVSAAFWALFSWKSAKEYEVEILALSWAERHSETFFKIHATSYSDSTADTLTNRIIKKLKDHELLKDFPNLITALIIKSMYDISREKYKEEYNKMLDDTYLIINTFDGRFFDKPLLSFYDQLNTYNDRRVRLFKAFETNFYYLENNKTLSKVERNKIYINLENNIESIVTSYDDIINEMSDLRVRLTEFNPLIRDSYLIQR